MDHKCVGRTVSFQVDAVLLCPHVQSSPCLAKITEVTAATWNSVDNAIIRLAPLASLLTSHHSTNFFTCRAGHIYPCLPEQVSYFPRVLGIRDSDVGAFLISFGILSFSFSYPKRFASQPMYQSLWVPKT